MLRSGRVFLIVSLVVCALAWLMSSTGASAAPNMVSAVEQHSLQTPILGTFYFNDFSLEYGGGVRINVFPSTISATGVIDIVGIGFGMCDKPSGNCIDMLGSTGYSETLFTTQTVQSPSFVRATAWAGGSGRGANNHMSMWLERLDGSNIDGCEGNWYLESTAVYTSMAFTCPISVSGDIVLKVRNDEAGVFGVLLGQLQLDVVAGPLNSLELLPNVVSATVNSTQQFTVTGYDVFGADVSLQPYSVTFTSPEGAFEGFGLYRLPMVSGEYPVSAQSAGISDESVVHATPDQLYDFQVDPGYFEGTPTQPLGFTFYAQDIYGNEADPSPVICSAVAGTLQDDCLGYTLPVTAGWYQVDFTAYNSITTFSQIHVVAGPLARIVLNPSEITGTVGTTATLNIVGYDRWGNVKETFVNPVDLSTSCGLIDAGYTYTFPNLVPPSATCTITAHSYTSSGDIYATTTAHVLPGQLDHLKITPKYAELVIGQYQVFGVAGYDANGNQTPFSYSLSATGGELNGDVYKATAAGTYTVTASSGSITDEASVKVTARLFLPMIVR